MPFEVVGGAGHMRARSRESAVPLCYVSLPWTTLVPSRCLIGAIGVAVAFRSQVARP